MQTLNHAQSINQPKAKYPGYLCLTIVLYLLEGFYVLPAPKLKPEKTVKMGNRPNPVGNIR